jgi:hypothetical protein
MSARKTDSAQHDPVPRRVLIQTCTQPEEDGRVLERMIEGWTADVEPETHMEAFLCRELATCEWRLERSRRIENGILWWAMDDIRDRNHEATRHGQPTGEEEMSTHDFFTLSIGRAFKLAIAHNDCLTRLSRIETNLARRIYKAMDLLKKKEHGAARKTGPRS